MRYLLTSLLCVLTLSLTAQEAQMMSGCSCDNTSYYFEANLLSLSGGFSVQSVGSILLLTACDAVTPVALPLRFATAQNYRLNVINYRLNVIPINTLRIFIGTTV